MTEHRFQGYSHPELYRMINSGPGPAASTPQIEFWSGLSEQLSSISDELNGKLQTLKATWQGQAGDAAQGGMTPLQQWANDAQSGSDVMKSSAELQAEYVSTARASMPEPVEVTTPAPSGWEMAGAALGGPIPAAMVAMQAADHEQQERARAEAEQKAVEVMNTYQSNTQWNTSTLGTFVPPPDVVVSTPVSNEAIIGGSVDDGSRAAADAYGGTRQTGSRPGFVEGHGPANSSHVSTVNPTGSTPTVTHVGNPGTSGSYLANPVGTTTTSGFDGSPLPGTTNNFYPTGNPNPGNSNFGNPYPAGGFGPGRFGTDEDAARSGFAGGRGGFGGGAGGVGAGGFDAEGRPIARGGLPGAGGGAGAGAFGENMAGRGAAGIVEGGAGRGGGATGPVGAGGRRADGEEDEEHETPDYLLETDDVFGDERMVAPPVIGETRAE